MSWTTLVSFNKVTTRDSARYLLARAADLTCGVDVRAVREIMPIESVTRIPGAPAVVTGMLNVRGRLTTLIDARLMFGQTAALPGRSVILVEWERETLAVAVDEVMDMIDVQPEQLATRADLPGVDGKYIHAVGRYGSSETFVALDLGEVFRSILEVE